MEIYVIPFNKQFIIYRPLCSLSFLANEAMVYYIKDKLAGKQIFVNDEVDQFLDTIRFWKPDLLPPEPSSSNEYHPTIGVLLMTGDCNMRCTYCYARGGEAPDLQMTFPLAQIIIDRVCENAYKTGKKIFSLTFHGGGEPTLNWDVMTDAVEYAKGQGLPCEVNMSTNGVWTSQQRKFILKHFNNLSISFDGTRAIQDKQRPLANGESSFDAVMETIRSLDEVNFHYGIRITTTPDFFESLPESIAFLCEETKCRNFQVEPCYSSIRGEYADPTEEQIQSFIDAFLKAFEIASNSKCFLYYSGARPWQITTSFCSAPENGLVVTPQGDIVTCFETCDRRHPLISKFVIGNISSSGIEINMEKLRKFHNKQQERRRLCKGCFCYWHCGGDCATKCMFSHSQERGRCQVNRIITRELLAWKIAKWNRIGNNLDKHN